MKKAADQVKRISLELGGNAPVIVLNDADLDKAADAIVENKFENTGQMCNGINTVLAQSEVKDELITKVIERVTQLRVGPGNQRMFKSVH